MESKRPIVFAVCLAALILPLSFSGAAVATPAIARDIGGSPVALTWIVNAFMLTFGSCLMAAGALADEYGRKRVFIWGVALFSITSFALGFAPNIYVFDILRGCQGIAAAGALAGGTAALAQEFEGHDRTRAFSLLGTTFGIGLAFGPLIAGLIIQMLGWRSVFLASTLVGMAALILGAPRMRETHDPNSRGLDWPGTVSFTLFLSLLTFAVIQAPENGWLSLPTVTLFVLTVAALISFITVELRVVRPMLELSLFRYTRFVGVQALPLATCFCYIVLLVLLPLRFIGVEGHNELMAGILMIALSAPMLVVPVLAATFTKWFSPGLISGFGLLVAAAGLVWLSAIPVGTAGVLLALPLLVIGFGTAMPWGLMDGLSVSVVPKERAGMATGIFSTTRIAGEGIALAIVSAIVAAFTHGELLKLTVSGGSEHIEQEIQAASLRLAVGDINAAASVLPNISHNELLRAYENALASVLWLLAAITVISAIVVFSLLGRPNKTSSREIDDDEAVQREGRESLEEDRNEIRDA